MCGKVEKSQKDLNKHVNEHLDDDSLKKGQEDTKECRNGISCNYLRQNRCKFYHEVAVQVQKVHTPNKEWQTAQTRKQKQQENRSQLKQAGHSATKSATINAVKWCINGRNCNKGKFCAFRHKETLYNTNFPSPPITRRR